MGSGMWIKVNKKAKCSVKTLLKFSCDFSHCSEYINQKGKKNVYVFKKFLLLNTLTIKYYTWISESTPLPHLCNINYIRLVPWLSSFHSQKFIKKKKFSECYVNSNGLSHNFYHLFCYTRGVNTNREKKKVYSNKLLLLYFELLIFSLSFEA